MGAQSRVGQWRTAVFFFLAGPVLAVGRVARDESSETDKGP